MLKWLVGLLLSAVVLPATPCAGAPDSYTIAVHVSRSPAAGTEADSVLAIREFVQRRGEELNAQGGILGRPVKIRVFDDQLLKEKTKENVTETLKDPNLISIIGIWSSTRGAGVVDDIGRSGVPFISEMSVETLFSKYPTVYTLTRSVRTEQQVFSIFARDKGFKRVAFVGSADDLYTRTYHDYLVAADSKPQVVSTFWLDGEIEDNYQGADQNIADMKAAEADVVFLSIRSVPGAKFLARMTAAGVRLPVFVAFGNINAIGREPGGASYDAPIYELAEGGIANLNNERLEQIRRSGGPAASARAYRANHIGYGARYADLVAMVTHAANQSESAQVKDVRARITKELGELREGKRFWEGRAQDWSFTRERASAERALLVWRPSGAIGNILAPVQYVRLTDNFSRVPVLYVHLDMVRVYNVDSNDRSFDAEFFFTIRSEEPVPISTIEFTNAYRSATSKERIINIRPVHVDDPGTVDKGLRVYKVSGRFTFEPDLRKYPFDEQVFSISFQPTGTANAFLLQPPAESLRKESFDVDGWGVRKHYVGTDDLLIRSISGPMLNERIIPYYTFNYTWVMKRQVIDYVLRVIVPLSCILIVAYLAIFIPRAEFNATIAIQVTALLSAIALYFALNQPQADDATLSDIIFVISYAIISVMIALSILEINPKLGQFTSLYRAVIFTKVYVVPVATFGMLGYLLASASADTTLIEVLSRGLSLPFVW